MVYKRHGELPVWGGKHAGAKRKRSTSSSALSARLRRPMTCIIAMETGERRSRKDRHCGRCIRR